LSKIEIYPIVDTHPDYPIKPKLAQEAKQQRLKKEDKAKRRAETAQRKARQAMLMKIAQNLPSEWRSAHDNAEKAHAHAYDAACRQLVDIRDAYLLCSDAVTFDRALEKFINTHRKRRALLNRLVNVGLYQNQG